MIQITREQANIILRNMLWKIIKADYPPSKDEQNTIKYLQDEVNKFSSNVHVSRQLPCTQRGTHHEIDDNGICTKCGERYIHGNFG